MEYLKIIVQCDDTTILEENLEEYCKSIATMGVVGYEIDNMEDILKLSFTRWQLNLVPMELTFGDLLNVVSNLCILFKIKLMESKVITDNTNYLLQKSDNDIFYFNNVCVYNHMEDFVNHGYDNLIPIYISQGMGFGTGKHETTSLCIFLIEYLHSKNIKFEVALDLGCGSGILSLVISKLFNIPVTASDIDDLAIYAAKEAFNANGVNIETIISDGFNGINNVEYSLIVANILMNPLLEMKNSLYDHLQSDGYLIVSGFLDNQLSTILNELMGVGFRLLKILQKDVWCAVLFIK